MSNSYLHGDLYLVNHQAKNGHIDVHLDSKDKILQVHGNVRGLEPLDGTDLATKNYVDSMIIGLNWKTTVRVTTTVTGTLSTAYANGQTIDGIVLVTGDRILIKNQSTGSENGVYIVNASGAPTRATDMIVGDSVMNISLWVSIGTLNDDTAWVCTNDSGSDIVGTDALVFIQFASAPRASGSNTEIQFNNNGNFGGSSDLTWDGTSLQLGDNNNVSLGVDDDLTLTHNGTNSVITSSTGELQVNSTGGDTVCTIPTGLGSRFKVQDAGANDRFQVTGTGVVLIESAFSDVLRLGPGLDLTMGHTGSDGLITNSDGDLTIDNTEVTGSTIMRLGTNTTATDFQVQQDSGAPLFKVEAAGDVLIPNDGTSLSLGIGADFSLVHSGISSSITNNTGDLLIDLSASTGDLNINLSGTGTADRFRVRDSTGSTSVFEVSASGLVLMNTDDLDLLRMGVGSNLRIGADGSNSKILSSIGDFLIDNTAVTGDTIMKLGDAAGATTFKVQDSASTDQFVVDSNGNATIQGDLDLVGDTASLRWRGGGNLSLATGSGTLMTWQATPTFINGSVNGTSTWLTESSEIFTVVEAGTYEINLQVRMWSNGAPSGTQNAWNKCIMETGNPPSVQVGVSYVWLEDVSGTAGTLTLIHMEEFAAGDKFSFTMIKSDVQAINTIASETFFTMKKL